MIHMKSRNGNRTEVTTIPISAEEQARESALRRKFADFWSSASGDMRSLYDRFISACPLTEDVTVEAIQSKDVTGWWIRPRKTGRDTAILYLHGGGYVLGSSGAYRGFVSQIVSRTGVPALVLDYPLAPEASLPAAPEAALAAWRSLVSEGFRRIAIVGDSAGGGLALVTLAVLAQQSREIPPTAGVVFSPWADLAFSGSSMTDPAIEDPLIGYEYLRDCSTKYRGPVDARDPLASPLFGDLRGLPPLLIQVGTDERLLDDSRQYAARAAEAGIPVQLEIWEGMHHVFQLDVEHIASAGAALDRAAHFLRNAFQAK